MKLGLAFGNGYYRWQFIEGSIFTHLLTALDPSKKDFGATWVVHATGIRFPATVTDDGGLVCRTWFPVSPSWNRDSQAWVAA